MPRDNPSCTITTSLGNFTAEIFLRQMPLTAANFIDLVEKRFYDGTHVHLLAPKMVLGMGCPHSKDPHSSKAGTGAAPDGSTIADLERAAAAFGDVADGADAAYAAAVAAAEASPPTDRSDAVATDVELAVLRPSGCVICDADELAERFERRSSAATES